MSRMNSSLLSLPIGKVSANPMMLMFSVLISYPPGARLSSRAVPSRDKLDSIVNFCASLHAGLVFLTVHCMVPVESRNTRNIRSFPSRLR